MFIGSAIVSNLGYRAGGSCKLISTTWREWTNHCRIFYPKVYQEQHSSHVYTNESWTS